MTSNRNDVVVAGTRHQGPVGACYDLVYSMVQAAFPQKECGSVGAARVKVLADTVGKAACGPNPVLALAYPETRTTYCFSR